jgi:hypothetical protein
VVWLNCFCNIFEISYLCYGTIREDMTITGIFYYQFNSLSGRNSIRPMNMTNREFVVSARLLQQLLDMAQNGYCIQEADKGRVASDLITSLLSYHDDGTPNKESNTGDRATASRHQSLERIGGIVGTSPCVSAGNISIDPRKYSASATATLMASQRLMAATPLT